MIHTKYKLLFKSPINTEESLKYLIKIWIVVIHFLNDKKHKVMFHGINLR